MAMYNHCTFIGRLGRDPEMNYTSQGTAVTKFSLAVDQGKDVPPLWLNITCWNELAERVNEWFPKGAQVLVAGRLQTRSYTDRNKVARTVVEIIASTAQLLERKKETQESVNADVTETGQDPE
jgi:single-strand DNA-binding protein